MGNVNYPIYRSQLTILDETLICFIKSNETRFSENIGLHYSNYLTTGCQNSDDYLIIHKA